MRTIWKFELETTDEQTIPIPEGGKILTVAVQREIPCLWVECYSGAVMVKRTFNVYGTGHPLPDNPGKYIGSYMLHGGTFVGHVYERN